jgi:hypothetical protein
LIKQAFPDRIAASARNDDLIGVSPKKLDQPGQRSARPKPLMVFNIRLAFAAEPLKFRLHPDTPGVSRSFLFK